MALIVKGGVIFDSSGVVQIKVEYNLGNTIRPSIIKILVLNSIPPLTDYYINFSALFVFKNNNWMVAQVSLPGF